MHHRRATTSAKAGSLRRQIATPVVVESSVAGRAQVAAVPSWLRTPELRVAWTAGRRGAADSLYYSIQS